MGCFSYLCKNSGKPVNSTSFDGDLVYLFLLEKGRVIEEMYGNYDSYGGIFNGAESFEWSKDWSQCVEDHFGDDESTGFAAVLAEHYDGNPPTTRSKDDPNQGWGESGELMGDTSNDLFPREREPYHKVY